jgi:hypothetical protein
MRKGERGQVLVMYTVALLAMLGVVGLVTDLGWAKFRLQAAQKAADAAALAAVKAALYSSGNGFTCGSNRVACQGATACPSTLPSVPGTNTDTACMYANANGFRSGSSQNVTVEANASPATPPTAPGVTPAYWVTVRVSDRIPQLFSSVLGNPQALVSARATAGVVPNNLACIYALDPSAQDAVQDQQGSNLTVNCGIYVDSNSLQALTCDGPISSTDINVVGGYTGTSCSPAPNIGAHPVPDPLSYLPAPAVPPTCDHTNLQVAPGQTLTLNPGTYCGGMFVCAGAIVTLNPGNYYLKGGGIDTTQNAAFTGSGVTFIQSAGSSSGTPLGLLLESQSNVTLKAATTGPYAGVLWYSVGNGRLLNDIQSQTVARLEGVLYTPGEDWLIQGQSQANLTDPNAASYTGVVAQTLRVNGSGAGFTLHSNYGALPGGSPFHKPALLE